MSRFRRNKRVRLKGQTGPVMVVEGLIRNPLRYPKGTRVVCVWHGSDLKPHRASYPLNMLEEMPSETPGK